MVRKALIFGKYLTDEQKSDLLLLLIKSGFCDDEVEFVDDPNQPAKFDDEVFIVELTEELLADPSFDAILLQALNGNQRRVVGLWPDGSAKLELPLAPVKYCYSIIRWSVEGCRRLFDDEGVVTFEGPDGDPIELPEPERRECP
jgi:hypothetical protein